MGSRPTGRTKLLTMATRSKVTDSDLTTMVTRVQSSMNDTHSDRFRRVWVQYSRIGKERVHVVVTLFPVVGTYRMVFFRDLNVSTISTQSILDLINVDN